MWGVESLCFQLSLFSFQLSARRGLNRRSVGLGLLYFAFVVAKLCLVSGDSKRKKIKFTPIFGQFLSDKNLQLFEKYLQLSDKNLQLFEKYLQLSDKNLQLFEKYLQIFDKNLQLFEKYLQLSDKKLQLFEKFLQLSDKKLQFFEVFLQIFSKTNSYPKYFYRYFRKPIVILSISIDIFENQQLS